MQFVEASIDLASDVNTSCSYAFIRFDRNLLAEKWEHMVGEPSNVRTRNIVADETLFCDWTNNWMAFVGIDASYFNPHSMCEELANGSHMNWEVDPESGNYKPLKNWTRSFKKENFIFLENEAKM